AGTTGRRPTPRPRTSTYSARTPEIALSTEEIVQRGKLTSSGHAGAPAMGGLGGSWGAGSGASRVVVADELVELSLRRVQPVGVDPGEPLRIEPRRWPCRRHRLGR